MRGIFLASVNVWSFTALLNRWLMIELKKKGLAEPLARHVCERLAKQCSDSAMKVHSFESSGFDDAQLCDSTSGVSTENCGDTTRVTFGDNTYTIKRWHVDKLKNLYDRSCKDDPHRTYFNTRLYCLCARYHFYLCSRNQGEL